MVREPDAFAIMASCFAPPSEEEWRSIASDRAWADFVLVLRGLLEHGIDPDAPRRPFRSKPSLTESLSLEETAALFKPPDHDALTRFSNRHFIGGLPQQSAMPVESLYANRTTQGLDPVEEKGFYGAEPAAYMRDLAASLGLSPAGLFLEYPDHLSCELEVLAYLLEEGATGAARQFLVERLAWLSSFRQRLLGLDDARFHLAIVDAILDIRSIAVRPQ